MNVKTFDTKPSLLLFYLITITKDSDENFKTNPLWYTWTSSSISFTPKLNTPPSFKQGNSSCFFYYTTFENIEEDYNYTILGQQGIAYSSHKYQKFYTKAKLINNVFFWWSFKELYDADAETTSEELGNAENQLNQIGLKYYWIAF